MAEQSSTAIGEAVNTIGLILGFLIALAGTILILWWIGVTFGGGWVVLMIFTGMIPSGGFVGVLVYVPFNLMARALGYRDEASLA